MNIFNKLKAKLTYTEVAPLIMDDKLRDAYQTSSIVGGELEGRIALITGATSGIGYAIAERLLNEGCSVIISGRNEQKLDNAIRELHRRARINNENQFIEKVLLDQNDSEKTVNCIHNLFEKYDISIVINNAGVLSKKDHKSLFRSITQNEYFGTININLKSTILISEIAAERMSTKSFGNILNISSICAFSRNHYYTPYGISKTGVVQFTKDLSDEYKRKGVVINSIAPGSIATNMNHLQANDNIASRKPLNHTIIPEQIAALAAFMVSNIGKYQKGIIKKACATEEV